ncbi:alpha/beta hydrolase, partial [Mesorhizobium sp. M6A.T.Ca.TU.002.02.2.1]
MATTIKTIETSHGTLAVRESAGTGMPVLMIHG